MLKKQNRQLLAFVLTITMLIMPMWSFGAMPDVEDHWSNAHVQTCMDYGVVSGYPDGLFHPDDRVTRAQFVTMLINAFGYDKLPIPTGYSFSDVSQSDWFYSYMIRAAGYDLVSGVGGGKADPNGYITREQAAVIMNKLLLCTADSSKGSVFSDINSASSWARDAIIALGQNGNVSGSNGNYNPLSNMTRAEAAAILSNTFGVIIDESIDAGGKVYEGNLTIRGEDVTLSNAVVKKDLIIAAGANESEIHLNNVSIEGKLSVQGGGSSSVYLSDCSVQSVTITKDGVRVVFLDGTEVYSANLIGEGSVLVIGEGVSIDEIFIDADADGAKVIIEKDAQVGSLTTNAPNTDITMADGANIDTLNIDSTADGTSIDMATGSTVGTANIDAGTNITGEGKIAEANISSDGVNIETAPDETNVESGVTATIAGEKVGESESTDPATGGGGGGGSGSGSGNGNRPSASSDFYIDSVFMGIESSNIDYTSLGKSSNYYALLPDFNGTNISTAAFKINVYSYNLGNYNATYTLSSTKMSPSSIISKNITLETAKNIQVSFSLQSAYLTEGAYTFTISADNGKKNAGFTIHLVSAAAFNASAGGITQNIYFFGKDVLNLTTSYSGIFGDANGIRGYIDTNGLNLNLTKGTAKIASGFTLTDASITVNGSDAMLEADSVTIGGILDIKAGTVSVSGILTAGDDVTVGGNLYITGGGLSGSSIEVNGSAGTLILTNSAVTLASIAVNDSGSFEASGSTFAAITNITVSGIGSFEASGSSLPTIGAVRLADGKLTLNSSIVATLGGIGGVTVTGNGEFEVDGSELTLGAVSFLGNGILTLTSSTVAALSGISGTGTLNVNGSNGNLTFSAITIGALNFEDSSITLGAVTLKADTATITDDAFMLITGGALTTFGSLSIGSTSNVTVGGVGSGLCLSSNDDTMLNLYGGLTITGSALFAFDEGDGGLTFKIGDGANLIITNASISSDAGVSILPLATVSLSAFVVTDTGITTAGSMTTIAGLDATNSVSASSIDANGILTITGGSSADGSGGTLTIVQDQPYHVRLFKGGGGEGYLVFY